ncbi:MAG TPA: rRNA maturation RNase YbeY [Mariprofundaceae bacterium]|nr:rRNA maturation RNase YbeY [Mariprofundaceae bacterium]
MIDVLVDDGVDETLLPSTDSIRQAVLAAFAAAGLPAIDPELCVRFASDSDVRQLNGEWRNQDKVTDVLSFPMQEGPDFDLSDSFGDIALAMPFVLQEAARLDLPARDHCLHLIIHACLHLLGFDHIHDDEAARMQHHEQRAMLSLGLHNPYPETTEDNL